jgi:hypothetical protein
MKTMVELDDLLLEEAEATAKATGSTLRELIEEGLRIVIAQKQGANAFKLRDGSVGGEGMARDFAWPEIREMIYENKSQ